MAIDERTLIETVFAPLAAGAPGAFALGDDAAVLNFSGNKDHVVTMDTLVEGVHFRKTDPAETIAKKALRVNISDLTAKGARPFAWFLSLALPDTTTESWVCDFARGLAEDQAEYGLDLYGGDTVVSPDGIVITVTMIGRCPAGTSVRRSGALDGDLIYVSGTIGDGALGLLAGQADGQANGLTGLGATDCQFLNQRYLLPDPPALLAAAIRTYAHAAMDISDGLVNDLGLMCAASGTGARVDIKSVPISTPARLALEAQGSHLFDILAGGDDYEVLVAVPPAKALEFERAAKRAGVAIAKIGAFTGKPKKVEFVNDDGKAVDLPRAMFRHFD
ncbi:MAG: thiamine-phosphate kinase [Halocynthiibacter sp.]